MTVNNSPSITHLIYLNNIEKMDNHRSEQKQLSNNSNIPFMLQNIFLEQKSQHFAEIVCEKYTSSFTDFKNIVPIVLILKAMKTEDKKTWACRECKKLKEDQPWLFNLTNIQRGQMGNANNLWGTERVIVISAHQLLFNDYDNIQTIFST